MWWRLHKLIRKYTLWAWHPPQIANWCETCARWYKPYVRMTISIPHDGSALERSRDRPPDITRTDDGETCIKCRENQTVWAMQQNIRGNRKWVVRYMGAKLSIETVEKVI